MVEATSTVVIETKSLSKKYGEYAANKSINLKIRKSTIHAIIGENGAGKSTLMKLLFGLERPSSGEILLNGRAVNFVNALDAIHAGIGMVQQHFALVENATAIENIILGAEPSRAGFLNLNKAVSIMESLLPSETLRVPWHTKIEDLSVGFRQRVEILKVIYRKADIMIFDEPTAVLTPQETEELYKILVDLKKSGKTILIITHKIEDVIKFADDYSVLCRGELVGSGSIADTQMTDLIQLMVGRNLNLPKSDFLQPGAVQLRIKNLSVEGSPSLHDLNLNIAAGEIVGLAGIEGAGQKPLVDAILGLKEYSGDIELGGFSLNNWSPRKRRSLGIANVPEDRMVEGIWSQGSAKENLIPGRESEFYEHGILLTNYLDDKATQWLSGFDVRVPDKNLACGKLSGGNQQKLILARELSDRNIKLFLCHQPTRGVDIGAIEKIHEFILKLRNQGTSVLLISSDLDELLSLSDRIIVLCEGKMTDQLNREEIHSENPYHRIGAAMVGAQHGK